MLLDQDGMGYDYVTAMRGGFQASQLMKLVSPVFNLIPQPVLVWLNPGMRFFFEFRDVMTPVRYRYVAHWRTDLLIEMF